MGLAGWTEVVLDPQMHCNPLVGKPAAAPSGEHGGLGPLLEPQNRSVEAARRDLPAPGHRQLDMVDGNELISHELPPASGVFVLQRGYLANAAARPLTCGWSWGHSSRSAASACARRSTRKCSKPPAGKGGPPASSARRLLLPPHGAGVPRQGRATAPSANDESGNRPHRDERRSPLPHE